MSSSPEKSKNKRPMEADPTSGEEQVQAEKTGPGREESPAPLPAPAGMAAFLLNAKRLRDKIERDRLAAKLGLIPSLPHESPNLPNWYCISEACLRLFLVRLFD
jgi:hypothetical protein